MRTFPRALARGSSLVPHVLNFLMFSHHLWDFHGLDPIFRLTRVGQACYIELICQSSIAHLIHSIPYAL